jgi:lipoyl(octanoyl) transferase
MLLPASLDWSIYTLRKTPFTLLESTQKELIEECHSDSKKAFLLISEPEPTFSCGKGSDETGLLWSLQDCHNKGIHVTQITRGGEWTYHGPGQIVLYPIFSLRALDLDSKQVRKYLTFFRNAILDYLESRHVKALAKDCPFGVYVGHRKLASFGVCISRGITSHGMSLYLENQFENFKGIVPCGQAQVQPISLRELGFTLTWEETAQELAIVLKNSFQALKN